MLSDNHANPSRMVNRNEPKNSLEDYPTPKWATRALMEHVLIPAGVDPKSKSVLEPACNRGYMASTLGEYFNEVKVSDIMDYGYPAMNGNVLNFLDDNDYPPNNLIADWIITNPPFNCGEKFVIRSLERAREGVAVFVRITFIETKGRYKRLFKELPPTILSPFSERVTLRKGKVGRKSESFVTYAWFIWKFDNLDKSVLKIIPPCKNDLEKPGDYDLDF